MTRPGVTDRMMLEHISSTWDRCTVYSEIEVTEPFKSGLADGTITPRMIRFRLYELRRHGYIESRGRGRGVVYRITPKGDAYLEELQRSQIR